MADPAEIVRLRYPVFGVDIEADSETVALLAALFEPFVSPDGAGRDADLTLVATRDGATYGLSGFDGRTWENLSRQRMLDRLVGWLNRSAVHHAGEHLTLHAAVLERDGEALLLAGDTGAGKSSTAIGLMERGWRYMSDEVAWVAPGASTAAALGKPLTVKPGTAALFAHLGLPGDEQARSYAAASLVGATATGHVRPRAVAILDKPDDDLAGPDPLEPCAAVVAIVANAFDVDRLAGPAGLLIAAQLATRCAVSRLPYTDIEQRLDAVEALWDLPGPGLEVGVLTTVSGFTGPGPRLADDARGVTIGDAAIIRHGRQALMTIVNPLPHGLWDSLDGTNTTPELVEAVAARHGLPAATIREDVVALLDELRAGAVLEGP